MGCSGGCNIPSLAEKLSVAARRRMGQRRLGCGAGTARWPVLCGPWGSLGGRAEGPEMGCGEHGAQAGDLLVGRRFKDLSITTSITLSGVGIMNQERVCEDPSPPRDLVPRIHPPLTPPASNHWEELDRRI